jgi:8-oxo-dGTP diphosphatase
MSAAKRFITAVLGLPINSKGQILLSQRHAPDVPEIHHKWQIIGGGVEFGESPEQALAREFQEETQLSTEILFPHPIVKTSVWTAESLNSDHDQHVTLITYLVRVHPEKPDWSNDNETADIRWFSIDELANLETLPLTHETIAEALELFHRQNLG